MTDLLYEKALDEEYRAELTKGSVSFQRCSGCGTFRHPARFACPRCLSDEWTWEAVSGRGTVETFLWYCEPVDPRFTDTPYNVALVRLVEGPGVFANIRDVGMDELAVGQKVAAQIVLADGGRPRLAFERVDD